MNFIPWKIVVEHNLMWMFIFVCLHWTKQFFMFINVQVYDDIWKLIILYPIDLRIIFSISLLQSGPPQVIFPGYAPVFMVICLVFWENFILWRSLLMIALYHQTKTPINFCCKWGLNPRSLIQPLETLPVELTGTY